MVLIIRHRINKIEELKSIPAHQGVEIDIRGYGDKLLLNHNPIDDPEKYDELEEYLKHFHQAFIIFNLKEAGYEQQVINLAQKYGVKDYFLLDVEFPYLYRATRQMGFRKIAIRYSEAEPISYVRAQTRQGIPLLDWVWVDIHNILPLNEEKVKELKSFKTCLVCPERFGRPQEIPTYIEKMKKLGFKLDAVMTAKPYVQQWEESGVLKE